MKPEDLSKIVRTQFYRLVPEKGHSLAGLQPFEEVRLTQFDRFAKLHTATSDLLVAGSEASVSDALLQLFDRSNPRLAWVASLEPEQLQPTRTVIGVCEFFGRHYVEHGLRIAVNEKTVEDLVRVPGAESVASPQDAAIWLARQLLCDSSQLLSGPQAVIRFGPSLDDPRSASRWRLLGDRVAVDIEPRGEGLYSVTAVVPTRGRRDPDHALILVEGPITFEDQGVLTQLRQRPVDSELPNYLAIWDKYKTLDLHLAVRKIQERGYRRYSTERIDNQSYFLQVFPADDDDDVATWLAEVQRDVIELSDELPKYLHQEFIQKGLADLSETSQLRSREAGRAVIGRIVNSLSSVAEVVIDGEDQSQEDPPKSGFMFQSPRGDLTSLRRREKALAKVAKGTCAMPQLLALLADIPYTAGERRRIEPLSRAAKKVFGGEPTPRQVEALDVALNTPDIALIQGPPGTGKTKVIEALRVRLTEEAAKKEGGRTWTLVTSSQHDAVENAVSRSAGFGLPTLKVGRRRDGQVEDNAVDRWRRQIADNVRTTVDGYPERPIARALTQARALAGRCMVPPFSRATVTEALLALREICTSHLSPALLGDLDSSLESLRQGPHTGTAAALDFQLALRAVESLRTEPESFADDGPATAYKALVLLSRLSNEWEEDCAILTRASEWDAAPDSALLDAIRGARERFLERLKRIDQGRAEQLLPDSIRTTMERIVVALEEASRVGAHGEVDVLWRFMDDIEYKREETQAAVHELAGVLAATCQQSGGAEIADLLAESSGFDTVIVDEAARSNPLDLLIPLSLAERRIVLVGDHRQLPQMLEPDVERAIAASPSREIADNLKESLFERLFTRLKERHDRGERQRTVTLDTQFRMHDVLAQFVSDAFYKEHGEAFGSGVTSEALGHHLPMFSGAVAAWKDIPNSGGSEQGRISKKRRAEAVWLADHLQEFMDQEPELTFGVIAFYRDQVDELFTALARRGMVKRRNDGPYDITERYRETRGADGVTRERLRIGTVDAFQGREFDVVFLSVVRSNRYGADTPGLLRQKYGHLMLSNRLCVSLSRQRRLLVAVGDSEMFGTPTAEQAVPGLFQFLRLCRSERGAFVR